MEADEEEEDLEAIQAHLDMTMALTYEAVEASFKNSTLPDDMVYETIDTYKPRPPRLGVGATRHDATANGIDSTTMARETARLHGRLAGKKRGRDETGGDINASMTTNGLKRLHLQNDDESEEEESRTAAIANKEKDKGKGKSPDKFAVRSKQKSKGGKTGEPANGNCGIPATTSPAKINPFTTRAPVEDTRFVAPAPPAKSWTRGPSSSASGDLLSPPQSPLRLLSPAMSHSLSRSSSASRTSRHSFSLSRRMMLKHQANASWRIVSVEAVTSPTSNVPGSPLLFKPKEHADTPKPSALANSERTLIPTKTTSGSPSLPAPTSLTKSKKHSGSQVPVLQLEPLEPSIARGGDAVEDGAGEQSQKKKRKRRRKKKKKAETAPLEEVERVGEDEGSD